MKLHEYVKEVICIYEYLSNGQCLKARLHIHGSDHGSLRFVTVSKIVENRDEPWSELSFLRMPTNNHGAATVSYDLSTVFLRVHAGLCRI